MNGSIRRCHALMGALAPNGALRSILAVMLAGTIAAAAACGGSADPGPTPSQEELRAEAERIAPLIQCIFPGYAASVDAAEGRIVVTLPPHCLSDWEVERGGRQIRAKSAVPVTFDTNGWDFDAPPWSCGKVRDDWPVALVPASGNNLFARWEGTLHLTEGCLTVSGTVVILPYPGTFWDSEEQVLTNEFTGNEYHLGDHIALGGGSGRLDHRDDSGWVKAPAEACYGREAFRGFIGKRGE